MAEKSKAAEAVQQEKLTPGQIKARAGVERARKAAERGELISRAGRRMNPASLQNLRPCRTLEELEPEKLKEMARKAQAKGTETQRQRRTLKEICQTIAELQLDSSEAITEPTAKRIAEQTAKQTGKPCTVYEAMAAAQAAQAMAGNVKAFVAFRDSAGDKPTENVEIGGELSANSQALLDKLAAINGLSSQTGSEK